MVFCAGSNATFLLALILICSPVAGLRPMRAALAYLQYAEPSQPETVALFRWRVVSATMSQRIASACRFGRSWRSANSAANCLSVTVSAVAVFAVAGFAIVFIPSFATRSIAPIGC